jgi:hypothetical protein
MSVAEKTVSTTLGGLDIPEKLKPYTFHGVSLTIGETEAQVEECPFCGEEGKFGVTVSEGLFRCFKCDSRGNAYTFLEKLWDVLDAGTKADKYEELAADRKLLLPDTLIHWGIVWNPRRREWVVPGRNLKGEVRQLYRYARVVRKRLLLATPGIGHQMSGVNLLEKHKPVVYLCEGVWDAMALWELLGQVKRTKEGLAPTGNPRASLLAEANVLSVPGSSVFAEPWRELFAGKDVALLYDNDHPKEKVPPAGLKGMERVAGILAGTARSVSYLKWGDRGYTLEKPSGWDLRDALTEGGGSLERRVERLQFLLNRVAPAPEEWTGEKAKAKGREPDDLEPKHCHDYKTLVTAWRKALRWTDGLDHALAVMLSCVTSTKAVGDQLWAKVISPPAGGKSTLAEALSVNKKYVIAKSTIRGFHSGFKEGSGDVDCSLVSQVMGKTLVTKDGDTLLQSPNLTQILSEARDLYDSTSRTHYRNNMSKDYSGVRMTWILCGTSSLRQIDSSELGERFLDCVIMEGIDDDLEDEVLMRVGRRAKSNLSIEAGDKEASHHDPRQAEAMRLTGGYVGWLRENAATVLPTIDISDERLKAIGRLGKFVAYMRARPSIRQEESAEREFASRLVSQLTRLAGCLAMVLNRRDVDDEVMKRVRRVAMDTARGMTLSICSHLADNPDGMERQGIIGLTGLSEHKVVVLTRFMRQIQMVEPFTPTSIKGIRQRQRWRLTPKMRKLYETVMEGT